MRNRLLAGAAAAGAALALTLAGTAGPAAAASDASLSVFHGVPGLTVDVWVNGERTLDDFTPGSMAGPLSLPAGTYSVAITAADATSPASPAIGPVDLTLASGTDYTAVAHLDAAASPTATLYTNDTSAVPAGQGRLTVRHDAAAPAVDVLANGTAVISGLANPQEQVLTVPAGTVSASVAAAGTTTPVLGPTDLTIAEGVNTIVYAWGSLADGTLALAVQTVGGMSSAPAGVPTGELGLADTSSSSTPWYVAAALTVGAAMVLAVRRARLAATADRD